MPFKNRVTEMLGIEHPVVMGGMTGVGTPELAAAVSHAGGLGIFPIHNAGRDEQSCREWIRRCKKLCGDKPFGVNLTILPARVPPPNEMYARVMVEEGVKIAETAGSDPSKWVPIFKKAGMITIHKCTSIRHALKAERVGTDIISLDGFECAGHPGEDDVGNYVLQAKGARTLKVPYICSGGVATGSQLAAALVMGAEGVNCGTLFCVVKESNWHINQKKAIVEGNETDTALVLRPFVNTSRVFKNDIAKKVIRVEKEMGGSIQFGDVAALMAGEKGRVNVEKEGKIQEGIWSAGQSMGLIDEIPTVQELMTKFMADAENSLRMAAARMGGILSVSKL